MSLAYFAKNAKSAERTRRHIQREGKTMSGVKLWTDDEITILRKYPHTPQMIREKLPHRTAKAIEHKRKRMGLAKKIHFWTADEISRLRRIYPKGSKEEICAAFPLVTWNSIDRVAYRNGIRRARRKYKPTGHVIVDQIREKCFELRWTMADLDRETKTRYFRNCCKQRLNYTAIGRALKILDGSISIKWPDHGE